MSLDSEYASARFIRCTFENNGDADDQFSKVISVPVEESSAEFIDCTFVQNAGGGFLPSIINSVFSMEIVGVGQWCSTRIHREMQQYSS